MAVETTIEPDGRGDQTPAPETPGPATAGARRTPAMVRQAFMRPRGWVVRSHRWLSLLLGIWILLECLTGTLLVFRPEIDRVFDSGRYQATSGQDIGTEAALTAAEEAFPDNTADFISHPSSFYASSVYVVYMTDADGRDVMATVDPGTGNVSGSTSDGFWLTAMAFRLHDHLNTDQIFGIQGLDVVGWLAVAWLVILITGAYAWYWPGVKRWARAVRVRRQRGWFTFNLDLHKAIGFLAFIPLTLIVITGINFVFPDQVKAVYEGFTIGSYQETAEVTASSDPAGREPLPLDQIVDKAEQFSGGSLDGLSLPAGDPTGVYDVYLRVHESDLKDVGGQRSVSLQIDPYSGDVLDIDDTLERNSVTQAYDDWTFDLHTGQFGGMTTRLLWVLVGLSPVFLFFTGLSMWLLRRKKRQQRSARGRPTDPDTADTYRPDTARTPRTRGHPGLHPRPVDGSIDMTARTTRTRAGVLGLLAALVAVASLGACARGEALPPTEAPPNPTTPPALVDDPEVEADIAAAFTAALDLGQPWTELRGRIDDGDDLEPTMEAVKGVISSIGASPSDVKSEISEVVITGDGTATIVADRQPRRHPPRRRCPAADDPFGRRLAGLAQRDLQDRRSRSGLPGEVTQDRRARLGTPRPAGSHDRPQPRPSTGARPGTFAVPRRPESPLGASSPSPHGPSGLRTASLPDDDPDSALHPRTFPGRAPVV